MKTIFGLVAAAFVAATMAVTPAQAGPDAERFAQRVINEGLAILRDTQSAERRARFHNFILQHLDTRKPALFALGNYRRGAAPQVLERYGAAFTEYSTILYESRLDDYKDTTLTISGSTDNKPNDVTVTAKATGPNLREPVNVAFRLLGADGSYKLVDVQVVGIWLSVELRDEFAAILGRNGGDIDALTAILIDRTRAMQGLS